MRAAPEREDTDDSIIVALGGNVARGGESVEAGLERALLAFPSVGLAIVRRSRLWRSAAWPDPSAARFLNAVVIVETPSSPEAVLETLHALEARFGRVRSAANAPRTLDLDLIAYGRLVRADPPILPHPRAAERRFVMGPLAEIAPRWRDPATGRRAADLALDAPVARDAAPLETLDRGLQRCASSLI